VAQELDQLAIDGGPKAVPQALERYKGAAVIGDEEREAVLEVLASRSLFRYYGPNLLGKVAEFERAFAAYLGIPYVLACTSGTAALRLALVACDVGAGDEVIVPAATFIATVNAVVAQGAIPIFAESDEHFSLDPAAIEPLITDRTKAIIPVHLYGVAAEMDPIAAVARRHGLRVIEDTAQACGSFYHGRRLGTIGDVGAFSFQLEKNITSGEGGAIATADEEIYKRAAAYADQGGQFPTLYGVERGVDGVEPVLGENLRLAELAGAILGRQLPKLDDILARVARNTAYLREALGELPVEMPPLVPGRDEHALAVVLYPQTVVTADSMIAALRAEGVPAGKVYGGKAVYMNRQVLEQRQLGRGCPFNCTCTDHRRVDYHPGMCPRTEDLLARGVVINVGPFYDDENLACIAHGVQKVGRRYLP
jgi:dTDP-4-amino-4,6-dideoxygalactose transaminase